MIFTRLIYSSFNDSTQTENCHDHQHLEHPKNEVQALLLTGFLMIIIIISTSLDHHQAVNDIQALLMLGLNPSEQEVVDMPNEIARFDITIIITRPRPAFGRLGLGR